MCDVHDDRADQRTGDGPPQVAAATAPGALGWRRRTGWSRPGLRSWPSPGILWSRHVGSAKPARARVTSRRRYGCRMLDRFKVAAREKLQRALAEVVAAEHAAVPTAAAGTTYRAARHSRPAEGVRGRGCHRASTTWNTVPDAIFRTRRTSRRRRRARPSCSSTCPRPRCSGNRPTRCVSRSVRSRGRGWRWSSGWRPAPRSRSSPTLSQATARSSDSTSSPACPRPGAPGSRRGSSRRNRRTFRAPRW